MNESLCLPADINISSSSLSEKLSCVSQSGAEFDLLLLSALGWSPKLIACGSPYFVIGRSSSCTTWAEEKKTTEGMLLELDPGSRGLVGWGAEELPREWGG